MKREVGVILGLIITNYITILGCVIILAKTELEKDLEKALKQKLDQLKQEGLSILDKGFKEATQIAIDEIKSYHRQYVERYYASYNPKVYIRNSNDCNLYTTLLRHRVYNNGNATIWFGPDKLEFFRHPQSDPGMVFDSFITNSRRQSPVVETKYPRYFGVGVVSFVPKGRFKILTGFQGHKTIFEDLLKRAPDKFKTGSESYVVEYFNKRWDIFLTSYVGV